MQLNHRNYIESLCRPASGQMLRINHRFYRAYSPLNCHHWTPCCLYHVIRFGRKMPATHKKFWSSLSTDQNNFRPLKKTLDRPKTFWWAKNSRPTKTILDWQKNYLPVKKFSTDKKNLDWRKKSSTVKKILNRRKTSRPTRRNLARSIWILKWWICISLDGMTSGLMILKTGS